METLKPTEKINHPDERNLYWVRLDTDKPVTLEDRYSQIAAIRLNPTAPKDVRSYFATIQNLCVYAWFAYDFYALVEFSKLHADRNGVKAATWAASSAGRETSACSTSSSWRAG